MYINIEFEWYTNWLLSDTYPRINFGINFSTRPDL